MRSFPLKRRNLLVALAGAAIALAPMRSTAADVDVRIRQDDGMVIHATAIIDADAGGAWYVLTDYARYPDFIPGVHTSRVLRRDGPIVTVEQTGTALLGLIGIPVAVVYSIIEAPPNSVWSTADIGAVGALHSHYAIAAQGSRVRLECLGRLAPRFDLLRWIEETAVRQTATRHFEALVEEIERFGARRAPSGDEGRAPRRRRRARVARPPD